MIEFKGIEIKDEADRKFLADAVRGTFTYTIDAIDSCITYGSVTQLKKNLDHLHRAERLYVDITGHAPDNSFRLKHAIDYAKRQKIVWPESIKDTYYWSQYE